MTTKTTPARGCFFGCISSNQPAIALHNTFFKITLEYSSICDILWIVKFFKGRENIMDDYSNTHYVHAGSFEHKALLKQGWLIAGHYSADIVKLIYPVNLGLYKAGAA